MLQQPVRRFWKDVSVVTLDDGECPVSTGPRYGVTLDGRLLRAPSQAALSLCSPTLAQAIADEWRAQDETIVAQSMPLTQLANTAQERVVPFRQSLLDALLYHVDADTLCHYADAPQDLVNRQHVMWTPLLTWAQETYGVQWVTTCGIMPVTQPADVHAAVARVLGGLSHEAMTAYQVIAAATSSAVIGLAVIERHLSAKQAFAAAAVDEVFQAERWGEDREAQDRRDGVLADLAVAERFLDLALSA